MANNIGDVLDIESPDSYIKRPARPMVIVEVKDISKLVGIIKIPSMTEGASPGDTTTQIILYSGLSNQCKKCRKFGHLAKICPLNRSPTQGGSIPARPHPEWRGKNEQRNNTTVQRWNTDKFKRTVSQEGNDGTCPAKVKPSKVEGTDITLHCPENLQHPANKNFATRGEVEKKKKLLPLPPTHTLELDQEMSKHIASPPHRQNREQQGLATLPTHESTPRTRLSFATSDLAYTMENGNKAGVNPFAKDNGEAVRTDFLQKRLEDSREGWTFQGKKKNCPLRYSPLGRT